MKIKTNKILTGIIQNIGTKQEISGIFKTPIDQQQNLYFDGFEYDCQADRKHHGGPEKAVHHYPFDHYAFWQFEIGTLPVLDAPGAFGENISTIGINEHTVAIGDLFQLGNAKLEVSQGRQPCWKLNIRFNTADMAKRVQKTGYTGWYYRVIEEGIVTPDDELILLDRYCPEWTIARLSHTFYVDTLNYQELNQISELSKLTKSWRDIATKRIDKKSVENWKKRTTGI
jgi:MOSC domain-containing protein YiiM